jgi:hypothetical protein
METSCRCRRQWRSASPRPCSKSWNCRTRRIESDGRGASNPRAFQRNRAGTDIKPPYRSGILVRRSLSRKLPEEPQVCPGDVQEMVTRGLRSAVGQHRNASAHKRPTCHSIGVCNESAPRFDGHRGPDQRATAVYWLHEERAHRPPHRLRVRRRHRPFRSAGAPRHGDRYAGSGVVGRTGPSTRDVATSSPTML